MKNHLLIAGTGRAGTTFLVQYLAACGLDTQLAREGHHAYDEAANAGLEDMLIGQPDAPYVCKSPWLYEYIERVLADEGLVIDAVVVPMRSLVEAATSRVVNEMRARYASAMPDDCKQWASWAMTPGGVVYSLNPIDQARLLALGFHELMHALVKRNIPVVFLDFPRFVEDHDYLYESLGSIVRHKIDRPTASEVHSRLAAPDKVRIGREIADGAEERPTLIDSRPQGIAFPPLAALDRIALMRELGKRGTALDAARQDLGQRAATLDAARDELEKTRAELIESRGQIARHLAEAGRLQEELRKAETALKATTGELDRMNERIDHAERQRDALEASTSWRITAPLRALSGRLRLPARR